jgi:hypothetical protein
MRRAVQVPAVLLSLAAVALAGESAAPPLTGFVMHFAGPSPISRDMVTTPRVLQYGGMSCPDLP